MYVYVTVHVENDVCGGRNGFVVCIDEEIGVVQETGG